jgi:hypothetical protein
LKKDSLAGSLEKKAERREQSAESRAQRAERNSVQCFY